MALKATTIATNFLGRKVEPDEGMKHMWRSEADSAAEVVAVWVEDGSLQFQLRGCDTNRLFAAWASHTKETAQGVK